MICVRIICAKGALELSGTEDNYFSLECSLFHRFIFCKAFYQTIYILSGLFINFLKPLCYNVPEVTWEYLYQVHIFIKTKT